MRLCNTQEGFSLKTKRLFPWPLLIVLGLALLVETVLFTRDRNRHVITGCTVMINCALAELAAKPENTNEIIMHDWWCALLAASFGAVSYVDRALVLYRQHGGNSVGAKNLNSLRYLTARIRSPADIKNSLLAKQSQAALLAETFPSADAIFREYGKLGGKRKSERLRFYAKNGIWKNGWQRNLGLLVWE